MTTWPFQSRGPRFERRRPIAEWLAVVAVLAAVGAVALRVTGGFSLRVLGVALRAHSPNTLGVVAVVALGARLLIGGWRLTSRELAVLACGQSPAAVAGTLAILCTLVGFYIDFGVASGADAQGYMSQAELWLHGHLVQQPDWLKDAPWPDAVWTSAPLGYRPAPEPIRAIVPIYPPGLPLLLALAKFVAGQCAMARVIPLCGGVLVWFTYLIGKRLATPPVGAAAAWFMATSPIVLFLLGAPMSDVPAGAAWAVATYGCFAKRLRTIAVGGLAAAAAILIRPQLTPLAVVLTIQVLVSGAGIDWTRRLGRCTLFAVGPVLGALTIGLFNTRVYGSPLISGYGSLGLLFSPVHVPTTARLYGTALITSHTPLLLAGIAALAVPARWLGKSHRLDGALTLLGMIGVVAALYLLYEPFGEWWYLRFFLPCWPAIAVGTAWLLTARAAPRYGAVALVILAGVGLRNLTFARDQISSTFRADLRYVQAAHAVENLTEPDSVILCFQQSGSVRYYAQRDIIRFDLLDPAWLDRLVQWFDARHRHVYVLLDEWEVPQFRERFRATEIGRLTEAQLIYSQNVVNVTTLYDTRSWPDRNEIRVNAPDPSLGRCNGPGLEAPSPGERGR